MPACGPGGRRRMAWLLAAALAGGCDAKMAPDGSAHARKRVRTADPLVRRHMTIGRSVRGRPIIAVEVGDPDAPVRTLVVGVIHGDETAGRAITRRLQHSRPTRESALWIVDELNPDGVARHTRQN